MSSLRHIIYRHASAADAQAMLDCRAADLVAGPGDSRMYAYFQGHHHPRQALAARIGFVALDDERIVGYIAGHLTRRLGCDGELQYLYVAPEYRRRGVAGDLLRVLSRWFVEMGAARVCVDVNRDSAGATPFYVRYGAAPLSKPWYVWDDIADVLRKPFTPGER